MGRKLPQFVDFDVIEEERGHYLLEDGTHIYCLFTVNDIALFEETIYGPELNLNVTVKFWARAPDELREKMLDRPLAQGVIPLKKELGWELVKIKKIIKNAKVVCEFDKYRLFLTLRIKGVARNMNYRDVAFNPLYNIAWDIEQEIKELR